jgi:hypothetical protein
LPPTPDATYFKSGRIELFVIFGDVNILENAKTGKQTISWVDAPVQGHVAFDEELVAKHDWIGRNNDLNLSV